MTIVTARDRAMRLPGVAVLAGYRREWLRGDLLAGVAVAAYLVPQVMAYSGIAGLPPQAGLWACLGSLAIVVSLVLPAVGVAIVAYSDNVLTARAFGARRGETIHGATELRALGAANVAAGLLRGFPVSSSGSRTAIGDAQGSRTQLHSLVALALVLVVLVAGGALLSRFPRAALGAVVIFAALRLIDIAGFRRIARFRRSEAAISVATMIAVLTVGVLYGVLVAVALSVLDLLHRLARPHDGVLGYVPGSPGCTTSTTTPTPDRCPACSSTATTPRSASPTPRTSAGARSPRSTPNRSHRGGSCSTPRRTSRSTAPPPRRWSRCTPSCGAAGSCWRSPASSRTCARTCGRRGCSTSSARSGSS